MRDANSDARDAFIAAKVDIQGGVKDDQNGMHIHQSHQLKKGRPSVGGRVPLAARRVSRCALAVLWKAAVVERHGLVRRRVVAAESTATVNKTRVIRAGRIVSAVIWLRIWRRKMRNSH